MTIPDRSPLAEQADPGSPDVPGLVARELVPRSLAEPGSLLRISDADRNGTLRRLHNAVALGLIDIDEFEERSVQVATARLRDELDLLVGDLPGPGSVVTTATDRVELRGMLGSLRRTGEWTVPTRLVLYRRVGSINLDLTRARFAGSIVVIELDMKFGSLDLRLPDGASASLDDVEVIVGSARDHRADAPAEGRPHVILSGKVTGGSIDIRGPRRSLRDRAGALLPGRH